MKIVMVLKTLIVVLDLSMRIFVQTIFFFQYFIADNYFLSFSVQTTS